MSATAIFSAASADVARHAMKTPTAHQGSVSRYRASPVIGYARSLARRIARAMTTARRRSRVHQTGSVEIPVTVTTAATTAFVSTAYATTATSRNAATTIPAPKISTQMAWAASIRPSQSVMVSPMAAARRAALRRTIPIARPAAAATTTGVARPAVIRWTMSIAAKTRRAQPLPMIAAHRRVAQATIRIAATLRPAAQHQTTAVRRAAPLETTSTAVTTQTAARLTGVVPRGVRWQTTPIVVRGSAVRTMIAAQLLAFVE